MEHGFVNFCYTFVSCVGGTSGLVRGHECVSLLRWMFFESTRLCTSERASCTILETKVPAIVSRARFRGLSESV